MQIYLAKPGGQREGPYTLEQINQDLASKKYSHNDYWAWHEGLPQWMPLHTLPGVTGKASPVTPTHAVPSPTKAGTPLTPTPKPTPPAAAKPSAATPIPAAEPARSPTPVKPVLPPRESAKSAIPVKLSPHVSGKASPTAAPAAETPKPAAPLKVVANFPAKAHSAPAPAAPGNVKPSPASKPITVVVAKPKTTTPAAAGPVSAQPATPLKPVSGVFAESAPTADAAVPEPRKPAAPLQLTPVAAAKVAPTVAAEAAAGPHASSTSLEPVAEVSSKPPFASAAPASPEPAKLRAPSQPLEDFIPETDAAETASTAAEPDAEPIPSKLEGPSGMPFSALEQIFVFTTGEGRAVFESPKLAKILQETVGEALSSIREKVPVDVVGQADVGVQMLINGSTPDKAWLAMNAIKPTVAKKAQEGLYKLCVRPFSVETNEVVALFLFYDSLKV